MRGAGLNRRRQAAKSDHVLLHSSGELVGQCFTAHVTFSSTANDLVIDVRDIAYKCHFITDCFKPTANDVKGDKGAAVTDMRVVVHRDAADVHFYFPRSDRFKSLFAAR